MPNTSKNENAETQESQQDKPTQSEQGADLLSAQTPAEQAPPVPNTAPADVKENSVESEEKKKEAAALSKPKQFRLKENGDICYQPIHNNPLPGEKVAVLEKGDHPLSPKFSILQSSGVKIDLQGSGLEQELGIWLRSHMNDVIGPLMKLKEQEGLSAPVIEICDRLYNSLGILPRDDLRDPISKLDTDTRREVRAKRIKLGPLLVFMPELNKPAAVRLRALLWKLYNGIDVSASDSEVSPYKIPADGTVSMSVDPEVANQDFYRAISYPVYGTRAVRIDMLDRVVSAIYDSAEKGKFQAKHQMAEWLGCPIDDLYAILESMGHKKIHDPADEASPQENKAEAVSDDKIEPVASNETAEDTSQSASNPENESPSVKSSEDKPQDASVSKPAPQPQAKPELATFALKKGRASQKRDGGREDKPYRKPSKKHDKAKGKRNDKSNKPKRVMSAGPQKMNPEDSPFAILQNLKK